MVSILFSMASKAAKQLSVKANTGVFKRLGRGNPENLSRNHQVKPAVCKYWLEGRCTKNPCRYLHPDRAKPTSFKSKYAWKNPSTFKSEKSRLFEKARQNIVKNKEDNGQSQIVQKPKQKLSTSEVNVSQTKNSENTPKLCKDWATENCTKGEKCENLHSWFCGKGLSMVTQLEGHKKAVTGIALPSGSSKLYCCSKDKSLRVWDCNSGKCVSVADSDNEWVTLVHQGPWITAGSQNMIKAGNFNTQHEVMIPASGGRVNAITMFEDILFAGMEDGNVLCWKHTFETGFTELASLKGHTGSVLSLVIVDKKLFSGSADHTIRVWDPESFKCMHVLNGHTDEVTTVTRLDNYLLSGSLDKKIKVWAATESGNIEQVYEHGVDDGVMALCVMQDVEAKPMLLCSCKDNGVIIYDLPSFVERGRVFSRRKIEAIEKGPDGLFFTGDASGLISVWKLNGESTS